MKYFQHTRIASSTLLLTTSLILSGCSSSSSGSDVEESATASSTDSTAGSDTAGTTNTDSGTTAGTPDTEAGTSDTETTGATGSEDTASGNTNEENTAGAGQEGVCTPSTRIAANTQPFLGNIYRAETNTDERFHQLWNQVTIENAGKWNTVEPQRDTMIWPTLDNAVNYAADFNYPIKYHTLISGSNQPAWMGALTAEEQTEEIIEWFDEIAARYPALDYIDVVSNPVNTQPSYIDALGGEGDTGWDWIIRAFELARTRFPDSKLLLNSFNLTPEDQTSTAFIEIAELLKTRDLIDGIGIEGHFFEEADATVLKNKLDQLAETALPLYLASFDMNLADNQAQLEKMKEVFPVFYDHESVEGLTLWGYRENQLWRKDAYLVSSNETDRPALDWLECYTGINER